MNDKQKRAYNAAQEAILALGNETVGDDVAFNDAMHLLARSVGAMLGASAAAHGAGVEELKTALSNFLAATQAHAAQTYTEGMDRQKQDAAARH